MRQSVCVDNKVSFDPISSRVYSNGYGTQVVENMSYQIGATKVEIDPKYSTSMNIATCPITATLYVLDDLTNRYVEESSSTWKAGFWPLFNVKNAGFLEIFQTDAGYVAE